MPTFCSGWLCKENMCKVDLLYSRYAWFECLLFMFFRIFPMWFRFHSHTWFYGKFMKGKKDFVCWHVSLYIFVALLWTVEPYNHIFFFGKCIKKLNDMWLYRKITSTTLTVNDVAVSKWCLIVICLSASKWVPRPSVKMFVITFVLSDLICCNWQKTCKYS